MPFGDQAIGRQARMQRTGGNAVRVGEIAARDGPEAHEVKVSVLGDQGIESPLDQLDAARQCVFALKSLEAAADAAIPVRAEHGGHVGVQERFAVAPSGDGQREADQFPVVKRPDNLAARFRGHHKQRNGHDVHVRRFPHLSFDLDAGFEFGDPVAGAD